MAITYQSVLAGGAVPVLQQKTVTAGTSNKTVNPDTGYDGLSQVTVEPTPSEVGAITAGTSQQTATPTAGKYFSSVTVDPTPTIQGIATPSTSQEVYTPPSGKHFSKFTVDAIPSEYIKPSGNKALSYTSNGSRTGIDVSTYLTASVNVNVQPTETTLWTNSSPTTAQAANTTITLSQAMSNFDYLKIKYRYSTSNSEEGYAMYPVSFFRNSPGTGKCVAMIGIKGTFAAARRLDYISDTQFSITASVRCGGTDVSTAQLIIVGVYGIKNP